MLADEDLKIAIDDARARHAAIVQLIYFTDSQAMSLLNYYTTIGVAAATGAVAALSTDTILPRAAGWALASAVPFSVAAALLCFFAMRTTRINLPGREADFWIWGMNPAIDRKRVFIEYLNNLKSKNELNTRTNERTGRTLRAAKISGIAIPLISLASGLFALWRGL